MDNESKLFGFIVVSSFMDYFQNHNTQEILFDAYIDKTKDLDFINPFEITGHARIMCDLY